MQAYFRATYLSTFYVSIGDTAYSASPYAYSIVENTRVFSVFYVTYCTPMLFLEDCYSLNVKRSLKVSRNF